MLGRKCSIDTQSEAYSSMAQVKEKAAFLQYMLEKTTTKTPPKIRAVKMVAVGQNIFLKHREKAS